jgi:uncharacterized protein YbjT (DUF2867 family)
MNLVVGATGTLGTEICGLLRKKNLPVTGLVRKTSNQSKRETLEKLGVNIAEGDLRDRDSLRAACAGVDTIISTATMIVSRQPSDSFDETDRNGHLKLIDEAERASVSRFIFISFPPIPYEFPLQSAKRAVEERLQAGKLKYTILQPTFFQEVWLGPHLGLDPVQGSIRIYGGGKNRISWISFRDVAKFAVGALDSTYTQNRTLPLGGPEALSPLEVVSIFEKVQNRKWKVDFVPEEILQEQYNNANDPTQKTFTGLMLNYALGGEISMKEILERIPVVLTSVRQYAEAVSR